MRNIILINPLKKETPPTETLKSTLVKSHKTDRYLTAPPYFYSRSRIWLVSSLFRKPLKISLRYRYHHNLHSRSNVIYLDTSNRRHPFPWITSKSTQTRKNGAAPLTFKAFILFGHHGQTLLKTTYHSKSALVSYFITLKIKLYHTLTLHITLTCSIR